MFTTIVPFNQVREQARSNSCGIFHCSGIEDSSSRKCFALQVYGNRPPFHHLHLNRVFIEKQGFKVGEQVILEPVKNVETCQWMEILPETYNDWNIIESTSCIIEEIFLQQIRVFKPGMVFVLHLSQGVTASLRVAQLMPKIPDGAAVLANNSTQVLVAPINSNQTLKRTRRQDKEAPISNAILGDPISSFLCVKGRNQTKFLRVLPRSLVGTDGFQFPSLTVAEISLDSSVYKKAELIRLEGADLIKPQVATLISLPRNGDGLTDVWLRVFEILEKESPESCWPSDDLRSLGLNCCTRFKFQLLKRKHVQKISTLNYSCSIETTPEIIKRGISSFYQDNLLYTPCLVPQNGGVLLTLKYDDNLQHHYLVRISSEDIQPNKACGYFWPDSIPKLKEDGGGVLKLRTENEVVKKTVPENFAERTGSGFNFFNFHRDLCSKFVGALKVRLNLASTTCFTNGHLLITGPSFGGKSTLMQLISQMLFVEMRVFSSRIDCNEWKGKSPEAISSLLEWRLKMLKTRAPSILLLDNLDFLNVHLEDEDRRRFISKVYLKIANLITSFQIQLIASSTSKTTLPSDLINFDGHQFFTDFLEIPPMKKEDLVEVFNRLLSTDLSSSDDVLRRLARLNVGETVKLCERLCLTRQRQEKITPEDISIAIDNLPPSNGVRKLTQQDTETSFKEIGGYESIKRQLREVFLWPIHYPQVYKSVGIRIGNGAILYGPSGCGKTLIARGLATEIGLDVIHVKGPELLSKYIGASEENVRKIFDRARQSKPTLIIFDEFDSLVPKRGHDNTGVTDRVVNQFLTELDGVDSSTDGVYVLAATNRLDLIDTALLRPGRFDHKIFVGLPNKTERLDILRLQCKDLLLEDEGYLEHLSDSTEGWSGAELRGLIVNAIFEASRGATTNIQQPLVTRRALEISFNSSEESRSRSGTIHGSSKTIDGLRVSLA